MLTMLSAVTQQWHSEMGLFRCLQCCLFLPSAVTQQWHQRRGCLFLPSAVTQQWHQRRGCLQCYLFLSSVGSISVVTCAPTGFMGRVSTSLRSRLVSSTPTFVRIVANSRRTRRRSCTACAAPPTMKTSESREGDSLASDAFRNADYNAAPNAAHPPEPIGTPNASRPSETIGTPNASRPSETTGPLTHLAHQRPLGPLTHLAHQRPLGH